MCALRPDLRNPVSRSATRRTIRSPFNSLSNVMNQIKGAVLLEPFPGTVAQGVVRILWSPQVNRAGRSVFGKRTSSCWLASGGREHKSWGIGLARFGPLCALSCPPIAGRLSNGRTWLNAEVQGDALHTGAPRPPCHPAEVSSGGLHTTRSSTSRGHSKLIRCLATHAL